MPTSSRRVPWYSSFYWRLGVSFILFVLVVLAGQSLMVGYARSQGGFAPGNPNGIATTVAADLGDALDATPALDVAAHLRERYPQPTIVYVVMRNGEVHANGARPLREEIRRQVQAALNGTRVEVRHEDTPTGPVVTAPVMVNGELRGMVVLPPPPRRGVLANVTELLSLPGTLVLVTVTAFATVVIFAPARQRLHALEVAAERVGGGDLTARAPERGRDEIARVSAAFNRMADELTARNEALRAADELRRQMLADISHELRTPLTTMRGYLDTLEMSDVPLDAAQRRRYADTVRQETMRLERIVLDLLELARFENGAAVVHPRIVAIERVFDSVTRRYEGEALKTGVRLSSDVADGADQVLVDPDRLHQVLSNLVGNALRHTPEGGSVTLKAAIAPAGYQLTVEDSGRGIPPDQLAHVFDRFYKIDPSRSGSDAGSGLGLSIARAIVERHGGTIDVASRPGRTTFVITLPHDPRM